MRKFVSDLKSRDSGNTFWERSTTWSTDVSGNVGMILAISILPLIICVGAAIDYSKMTNEVQKAQDAADAAVLAAAHEYYVDFARNDSIVAGKVSSDENILSWVKSSDYDVTTEITELTSGNLQLKTTISGISDHTFMGVIGRSETPWSTVAYSEVAIPKVEIMLVIDASASMEGQKFQNLQSALTKFVEDISPYKKGESHMAITLLPFAENMNFGIKSQDWLDPNQDLNTFNGCFLFSENDRARSMTSAVFEGGFKGYPYCPESEAVLFSTDSDALIDQIENMGLGYGTDTERALVWAERFLDNSWRNSSSAFAENRPIQLSTETQKVVIVLTDGEIAITDSDSNGVKDHISDIKKGRKAALESFTDQCRDMEQISNLDLYTVAYSVKNNTFETVLRNCVSGDGEYFDADIGDLDAIFEKIANSLTPVRISG